MYNNTCWRQKWLVKECLVNLKVTCEWILKHDQPRVDGAKTILKGLVISELKQSKEFAKNDYEPKKYSYYTLQY